MKKCLIAILLIAVCCLFFACENMPVDLQGDLSSYLSPKTQDRIDADDSVSAPDEMSEEAPSTDDEESTKQEENVTLPEDNTENDTEADTKEPEEEIHTHAFSKDWSCDKTHHWHAATCGHEVTSDNAPHLWDDGVITTPATESAEGERTYFCTICRATKTEPIDKLPHEHKYGDWTTSDAPTCTLEGTEMRRCACGETETRRIAAKGHTEVIDPAVSPTCTETGLTAGSHCSVCLTVLVKQTILSAKGHSYGNFIQTKDPFCTADGEETRTCSACFVTETRAVAALGHNYKTTVTPPTCTTAGYTTYACTRCDDSYTADVMNALGHDIVHYPAKAPTCTEIGWAAYSACSRCDLTTFEEIPMTAHDFDEDGLCTVCDGERPATDGLLFTEAEDGSYRVSGYEGEATEVYIPRKYNDRPVSAIDAEALKGAPIVSLFVPPSVHDIGSGALAECTSLERITLPFVGGHIDAVTADATTLFGYIFGTDEKAGLTAAIQYYSSTESAVYAIPDSLRSVRVTGGNVLYGAFCGCARLTNITIDDSVTLLGKCAFQGCSSLESLTIPFVGDRANVTPTDTNQYPFGYLFGALSYENAVYVTQYYYAASPFLPAQASYYIPASLSDITVSGGKILYGAFSGCEIAFSVLLDEGVTSIENAAFSAATGLYEITIPRSVTYIGNDVFADCRALTALRYLGTTAEWDALTKAPDWAHNAPSFTVYCLDDSAE